MLPMNIETTYRISTPLFCSGVALEQPELRLPSFKGVLRYWWRALAWSQYGGNLQEIQSQENSLFGSTGNQSRVLLRLLPREEGQLCRKGEVLTTAQDPRNRVVAPGARQRTLQRVKAPGSRTRHDDVVGEGARYLGYGVMEAFGNRKGTKEAGQLTRACLLAPLEFTIQLRVRNLGDSDPKLLELLEDALIALGTLGGMGAKSRKGYGSLVLQSLRIDGEERWDASQSMGALGQAIGRLSRHCNKSAFPDFTAFSSGTRHVLLSSEETEPLKLLDLVGRELIRYRSWGRHGKLFRNEEESEKRFKDDHDLMSMKQPATQRRTHPRRIAFGLPHNYGNRKDYQVGPGQSDLDRRASPLFIHIHQCGNMPVAVLSLLPARFLPKQPNGKGSYISVGGQRIAQKPEEELYQPIHAFLDRLLDPAKRKEQFTTIREVEVHP